MSDFLTNITQTGLGVKSVIKPRLPGWFEPWTTGGEPPAAPDLESTTESESHDDPALAPPAGAAPPSVEAPTTSASRTVGSDAGGRPHDASPAGVEPPTARQKKQGDTDPAGSIDLERLAARLSPPSVSPPSTEPQGPPPISPSAVQPVERPVESALEVEPPILPPQAVDEASPATVSPDQLPPGLRATPEAAPQSSQAVGRPVTIEREVVERPAVAEHQLIKELTAMLKPDRLVQPDKARPIEIRTSIEPSPEKQEDESTNGSAGLHDRLAKLERKMISSTDRQAPPEMPERDGPAPFGLVEPAVDQSSVEPISQVSRPDHPPLPEPFGLRQADESRPPPTVQVTIGRVEVRATTSPAPAPKKRAVAAPVMSLDEYLRQRDQGGGR